MSKNVSFTKKDKDPTGVLPLVVEENTIKQQVETCKLLLLKRQVFLLAKKPEETLSVQEWKVIKDQ